MPPRMWPHMMTWAWAEDARNPIEAAEDLGWRSRRRPGGWHRVTCRFRYGHAETGWAGDARLGGWGPDRAVRLVVATTDPATLPERSTWYRVQLLLTGVDHRPTPDSDHPTPRRAPPRPPREGAPPQRPQWTSRDRCPADRSHSGPAAGRPRPQCRNATGKPGHTRPHHANPKTSSPPPSPVIQSPPTSP
jgi:hypothetical protein